MSTYPPTNFAFLKAHDEQLLRLGMLAERYFADDPNTCLLKLRQLAELLAQFTASYANLYTSPEEAHTNFSNVCKIRAFFLARWRNCSARYGAPATRRITQVRTITVLPL